MTGDVDRVARELIALAHLGRQMPPSWDHAQISHPVMSQTGELLGKIMPGRGLYLDCDLKALGIIRPLPHVYEKTPVRRMIDFLKSERLAMAATGFAAAALMLPRAWLTGLGSGVLAAIQSYDGIINARGNSLGFDAFFSKISLVTVANTWSSLAAVAGQPTGFTFTNIPGGSAPDNTNSSSLLFGVVSAPTGGNKAYLQSFGYTATQAYNTLLLIDLLVAAGNISGSLNTAQTINTTALTRYTTGAGVQMVLEVTTQLGATASNLTVSYTNQASTAGQVTASTAMVTSAIVGRLQPSATVPFIQLLAGDYGVKSVQSLTLSASMTAGVMAIELFYPLTFVPGISSNLWVERDQAIQLAGLKELVQTSGNNIGCIQGYVFPSAALTGQVAGFIRTCQG